MMSESFDPYHSWLGIPPEEQPPNYYQLLGVQIFESDSSVIENASVQRIRFVRNFQIGVHGSQSQQILNELARARVCLLDQEKKTDYDSQLKSALAAENAPAPQKPNPVPAIAPPRRMAVSNEADTEQNLDDLPQPFNRWQKWLQEFTEQLPPSLDRVLLRRIVIVLFLLMIGGAVFFITSHSIGNKAAHQHAQPRPQSAEPGETINSPMSVAPQFTHRIQEPIGIERFPSAIQEGTRFYCGGLSAFEFIGVNEWEKNGSRDRWIESERTSDYIELVGEQNSACRLYPDRFCTTPTHSTKKFSQVWSGQWELDDGTPMFRTPFSSNPESWRVRSLGMLSSRTYRLKVSPDGQKLLLLEGKVLTIYDLTKGQVTFHGGVKYHGFSDAAFSPDGKTIAVTSNFAPVVTLFDSSSMKKIDNVPVGLAVPQCVQFSSNGQKLVGHSVDSRNGKREIWAYDLKAQKRTIWPRQPVTQPSCEIHARFVDNSNQLFSVERRISQDKRFFTEFKVWLTDTVSGKSSPTVQLGSQDLYQLAVSPAGDRCVVMQPAKDPRILDLNSGQSLLALDGHNNWVACATFSPDGQAIASASGWPNDSSFQNDKFSSTQYRSYRYYTTERASHQNPTEIIVRDSHTGEVTAKLENDTRLLNYYHIGYSPRGDYLFAITKDMELVLWGNLPTIPDRIEPLPTSDKSRRPARYQREPVEFEL